MQATLDKLQSQIDKIFNNAVENTVQKANSTFMRAPIKDTLIGKFKTKVKNLIFNLRVIWRSLVGELNKYAISLNRHFALCLDGLSSHFLNYEHFKSWKESS